MRNEFCKNIAEMLSFLMFAVIFDAGKITGEFYTMLTIIFFCFILVSLLLFLFYYTKNQDNNYYQYKKPTLFVICGLPASGKTTMAKKLLSINNAILLSEDEWMEKICNTYYNERYKENIIKLQEDILLKLLSIGTNIILDGGYWSKQERDFLRKCAIESNANFKLYYTKISLEELKNRNIKRNKNLTIEFQTKLEDLDKAWNVFEAPDKMNEECVILE